MKIFLIGFMGSGKTSIGKRLAEKLAFNFVDTDRFIEMQQGLTVAEIFSKFGESAFREMEHKLLLDLQKCKSAVISTGGGTPCHNENMKMMLACGIVIYLKTSPENLTQRLIRSQNERPLIKGKSETELLQYIIEKLTEREQYYNCADIVVENEVFFDRFLEK